MALPRHYASDGHWLNQPHAAVKSKSYSTEELPVPGTLPLVSTVIKRKIHHASSNVVALFAGGFVCRRNSHPPLLAIG